VTIIPVICPDRDRTLLWGNRHHLGPNNQVVGADGYRVAMTLIVPSDASVVRTDLEHGLLPDHRRPDRPYGLALLESQELCLTMITEPSRIYQFQAGGGQLPSDEPAYVGWPRNDAPPWEGIIPESTWYPGGTGVLGEYDGVDGAKVTLFEYAVDKGQAWNDRGMPTGVTISMVSWHCDRCHTPYPAELDERWVNRGPGDRMWAARKARSHARGSAKCTPPTGEMERVVSEVFSEMRGTKVELPAPASACAAGEGCSRVRQARAVTARLVATGG